MAFERGKFLPESTSITFWALKHYSLSLVFFSAYAVLNKIFYSINLAKVLLAITIIGILLKLIANFLLVKVLQQYGLALSTSITYIFFFISSYLILNYKLKIKDKSIFVKEFVFCFIAGGISILIVDLLSEMVSLKSIFAEIIQIIIFLIIYSMNLFIINHRAVVIFQRIFFKYDFFNQTKA